MLDSPGRVEHLHDSTRGAGTDDGDGDGYKHYVDGTALLASRVTGMVVTALCGKTWVPWRDPKKYPLCPACAVAYKEMGP